MKSITIHNLDSKLAESLELLSKTEGISLNKLIKRMLRQSLGVSGTEKNQNLLRFMGTMTPNEADAFFEATSSLSEIDLGEW